MSNFIFMAREKETGDVVTVLALDDYFGSLGYGYRIAGEYPNATMTQDFFDNNYERVEEA